MNPQKKYVVFKKLPQLGLNKEDWKLVQQIKAQGYEWSSWVRDAIREKAERDTANRRAGKM